MPSLDINSILQPISAEFPCGVDLEAGNKYDPAFAELERLAIGKAEQQIGNTLVPAESPDWKLLERKSAEILARSKDLRAATHLARALLQTAGWTGFAQGLEILRGLVEQYWDGMYPRLDPEDDNDPTMRINILMSITEPEILSALRSTPLVVSRSMGRFSLKDLETASGDAGVDPNMDRGAAMASIEAAVMDADLAGLEATVSAVRACQLALASLEGAIAARVDLPDSLSFTRLLALARKAETFVAARFAQRSPAPSAGKANGVGGVGHAQGVEMGSGASNQTGSAADNGTGDGIGNGVVMPAGMGSWSAGGIRSRDDVLKALNAISAYYEKFEPSSPIPLFMGRCKRLVTMSFVDIVRDLVPDALTQVDVLRGRVE